MGIQYHKVASSLPAAVPDGTLLDHVLVDQYNRPIGASVPVDSTGTPLGTLANPLRNQQVGISTAQIVDALGNGVTVTGNKLDVNVAGGGTGGGPVTAIAGAFVDGALVTEGTKIDAPATTATTDSWSIVAVLKGVLKVLLAVWDSGTHLLVTFSNSTIGISAGTAEIGNVKNGGTFAVQSASTIADGSSVTLGAKADAKSTATDTTPASVVSILKEISAMEQAPASRAVTNTGTFAVQSASTIADNAHVTFGAKADNRNAATDTTAITAMAVLKQLSYMLQNPACGFTAHHFTISTAVNNTAVALAGSTTPAKSITIQPKAGNANTIYIGGSGISTSNGGVALNPGDNLFIAAADLATVFVVAVSQPDGVQGIYAV